MSSNIYIGDNNDLLADKLGYYIEDIILQKLKTKKIITIGLSGGSMIDLLASILPRLQYPWAYLRCFFVDERYVSFTSDDSTYGNYQSKLFRQLPLVDKNIIKIDPTLTPIEKCAEDYENKLQDLLNTEDKVKRKTFKKFFLKVFFFLYFNLDF